MMILPAMTTLGLVVLLSSLLPASHADHGTASPTPSAWWEYENEYADEYPTPSPTPQGGTFEQFVLHQFVLHQ